LTRRAVLIEKEAGSEGIGRNRVRLSRRDFVLRGGAAALALPLLGSCRSAPSQPAPGAAETKVERAAPGSKPEVAIRFAAGASPGYGPFHIVEDTDIYRRLGATTSVQVFDTGPQGLAAIRAGRADVASAVDVSLIHALATGGDAVLPSVFITADDLRIVGRSGIKAPADFKGKRVGLIFGSSADYAFNRYLGRHGLRKDDVQGVNVNLADQVALLMRGDIDAFVSAEPYPDRAKQALGNEVDYVRPGVESAYTTVAPLAVGRPFIEEYGDEGMEILLRGLADCGRWITENRQDAARIAGAKVKMDQAGVARLWDLCGWKWDLYWSDAALDSLVDVANWMQEHDRLRSAPDWSKYVSSRWLRQVDPASAGFSKYGY
jgi:ABC-type nitrate/sulfonate/bicarbonate transport system substrate-binding protein